MRNLTSRLSFSSGLLFRLLLTGYTLLGAAASLNGQTNCACTNCPQAMDDLFQGNFYIQVQNAANATLGQNGQGVCGVTLFFDHEFVGDLLITLSSPAGQTITLVGPTGFFGETDGTTWDVTFVPCSTVASPDPGFAPTWSNAQPWGILGYYTGSYHPFDGCLESFNTGPVNGQWTLSVTDELGSDVGNFYDYSIIFCDPSGIDCFSCVANAGNLLQPDVTECAGDSSLNLSMTPAYTPPQTPPPATTYAYEYIIGSGGVIVGYETGPDLSDYPPGSYTVCGLSYLKADSSKIPAPNGAMTVTQLATQLNSSTPPFCGKITSNCVNVNILPPVENIETFDTICAPACLAYYGEQFCTSGDHIVALSQNGCPYTATLHLLVVQPDTVHLYESICPGACAQTVGFTGNCAAGNYTQTYPGSNGCDSIVVLHLTVLEASAVIAPPAPLSCTQPSVALDGSGSTPPGPDITYTWTATSGGVIGAPNNQNKVTAMAAGAYQLVVCRSAGGITCCDTAIVSVQANQNPPPAPAAILGADTVCPGQYLDLHVAPVASAVMYQWNTPSGVILNSGQGTTTVNLTWNMTAGDTVCVSAGNACGNSDSTCLPISVLTPPVMPTMPSGPVQPCSGDTAEYWIPKLPGALGYLWNVPTGGVLITGQNTDTIRVVWTLADSAGVCVQAYNACDTSAKACLPLQVKTPPPAPILTGPDTACAGSTAYYQIDTVPGAAGYSWKIDGGKILGQSDTTGLSVLWDLKADTGAVCVQPYNACGAGPLICHKITLLPLPAANAGPDQVYCGLSGALQANLSNPSNHGYWSLSDGPGGVTFADSLSPICAITALQPGVYHFVWTEQQGICQGADSTTVRFNSNPVAGPLSFICDSVGEHFTVQFDITGGVPPYFANANAVTGNQFGSAPIPSGGAFAWEITDKNGCSSDPIDGTHLCACISQAGLMSDVLLTACAGDTVQAQYLGGAIQDPNDTLAFILHTGSTASLGQVLAISAAGRFVMLPVMAPGLTYYISAVVGNKLNGQPDIADPCLAVSTGQPVVFYSLPVADAGPDTTVCGSIFTLNASGGAGAWSVAATVPGGGLSFLNANAPSTIASALKAGTYLLRWSVTENGCSGHDDMMLTFYDSISIGNTVYLCDSTNEHYIVHFDIAGGKPPYTVNGLLSPGNTFYSNPILNGGLYNFTIEDNNKCAPFSIDGLHVCACGTKAGAMADQLVQVCAGDSVKVAAIDSPLLDGNDAVGYILHTSDGALAGKVLAENTTGIFGFAPGMDFGVTYYVSQVAGNAKNGFPDPDDPCYSISPGQPVRFLQRPQPFAGPDTVLCGLSLVLPATASAFPGAWSLASGPGNALFALPGAPNSDVNVSLPGAYMFTWTEQNGQCAGFDDVLVTFHPLPVLSNLTTLCNPTNTAFTIAFKVTGGTPPFAVDGLAGVFNGDLFASLPLINNSNYAFFIKDANGCSAPPVSGSNHCQCSTNAGTMAGAGLSVCANQTAVAIWNNDGTPDPDDGVKFVLHDMPGPVLGTVLAVNNAPEFTFTSNLKTGVTYYISAVAGNLAGGAIDWNDPCLSVSAGTPVQWRALPEASLSGDTTICSGQPARLIVQGKGTFPLQVIYRNGNSGLTSSVLLPDSTAREIPITPLNSTIYVLASVQDAGPLGCASQGSDTVQVEVIPRAFAGIQPDTVLRCSGDTTAIGLYLYLKGADSGGAWNALSPGLPASGVLDTVGGIVYPTGLQPGTYLFSYRVPGEFPCPDDSVVVRLILLPPPVADAGPDQELTCMATKAILGGTTTSAGHGETYQWRFGGDALLGANMAYLETDTPGFYLLEVKDQFGCTNSDVVLVSQLVPTLSVSGIAVQPVRCYGEANGSLRIGAVSGGTPPVLFALNDGPFGAAQQFSNLAPGAYWLTAQDAAGCEWASDTLLLAEPPEIKINLGSDIEAALGDSVYLVVEGVFPAGGLDTVIWSPLLDSAAVGRLFQRFLPLHSGKIRVTVIDTNGCSGQDEVILALSRARRVYFPTVFSPGKELNDVFMVFGGTDVAEVEAFRIYDRWGGCVFEAGHFRPNDPGYGWNGAFRGQKMPQGVYAYYALIRFVDGEREIFSGGVTLLR